MSNSSVITCVTTRSCGELWLVEKCFQMNSLSPLYQLQLTTWINCDTNYAKNDSTRLFLYFLLNQYNSPLPGIFSDFLSDSTFYHVLTFFFFWLNKDFIRMIKQDISVVINIYLLLFVFQLSRSVLLR